MKYFRSLVVIGSLVSFESGCGIFEDEDRKPEVFARFQSEPIDGLQLGGEMDVIADCSIDPNNGQIQAEFSGGNQSIAIAIREISDGDSSVHCQQSPSNYEDRRYIGDGYEGCAVEIQANRPGNVETSETYGLYRNDSSLGLFATPEGCELQTHRAGNTITGNFNCASLVQLEINGIRRNPIADTQLRPRSVAAFSGWFRCDLERKIAAKPLPSSPLPPIIAQGSLNQDGKSQALTLRSARACKLDPETGSLSVELDRDAEVIFLSIRDFARQPASYPCTQSPDNVRDGTELGNRFEGCSVRLTSLSSTNRKKTAYGMYRHDASVRPFQYQGSCSIDVTSVTEIVKGSVHCTKMAQTLLNDLPRNPAASSDLVPLATADLALSFQCGLE